MSTLKLDTLSNKAGTASVPSDAIVSGTAKAWVNFNGTGTVAIRRAFNVSSITDNGTGSYTVNFTNAMSDLGYVTTGSAWYPGVSSAMIDIENTPVSTAYMLVTVVTGNASGATDASHIAVTFFS